jgi:hypothetical protein
MTFGFLESDELLDIRAELQSFTDDVATMDAGSAPLTCNATPEEIRCRQLQLLLIHLRAQNRRAKAILDELRAHPTGQRTMTHVALPGTDLPNDNLVIELFEGYTESLD